MNLYANLQGSLERAQGPNLGASYKDLSNKNM